MLFNIFKRKKGKVFNIKFIATGFMSNKYLAAEFTGEVSNWELKHNGVLIYFWFKHPELWDKYALKNLDVIITEI